MRLILIVFTLSVTYRAEYVVFLIIIIIIVIVIIIITRKKYPFIFGHSFSLNNAKSNCITVLFDRNRNLMLEAALGSQFGKLHVLKGTFQLLLSVSCYTSCLVIRHVYEYNERLLTERKH